MRILIVEDDPKMARILAFGLGDAGHAVDVVSDGETAFLRARDGPYDVLVLDVMLPGRDGLSVCRSLRESGSRLPVLLLTARDTVADRVAGLDSGGDDYLVKPFAFEELLARLRSLGRRARTQAAAELHHANLVLDPARRRVTLAGEPVELTPREFALLEVFLERPGEVITRSVLIERVWNEQYDGFSNVVDVYVGRLRRKLTSAEGCFSLRTVRGAGYVLDPAQ